MQYRKTLFVFLLGLLLVSNCAFATISTKYNGDIKSHSLVKIGIILPASPDTVNQYLSKVSDLTIRYFDGLKFYLGNLYGQKIVIGVPKPIGGLTYTAIDCFILEKKFRPEIVIDPGTSGSHLYNLSIGDVVIGARVVNFGNYMTTRKGGIIPGSDNLLYGDKEGYNDGKPDIEYIYSDPTLIKLAYNVAKELHLYTNARYLHAGKGRKAWVMEYGTQGSAETWLRDPKMIRASTKIFGEVDESGDFPIALISYENRIPFIEIHTIANASLNFKTKINTYFHDCSLFAQKRSNLITMSLIKKLKNINLKKTSKSILTNNKNYINSEIPPQYVILWTKQYRNKKG